MNSNKNKNHPMTREQWIMHMYDMGNRGIKDFNSTAKKIIPANKNLIKKTSSGPQLKKLNSKLDVQGYDMPREDIKNIRLKNKRIIRVGGNNIIKDMKDFKKYILPYINKSFTQDELKKIDLYIEYPSKNLDTSKFDGVSTLLESNKHKLFNIIDLPLLKDGPTALHEMVHIVRYKNHTTSHNISKDEAETVLETYARLGPNKWKKIPCHDSYYSLVKNKNKCKARNEDMEIINKSCNLKNKKGLTKCIRKNLHKTNIGKIDVPDKYKLRV